MQANNIPARPFAVPKPASPHMRRIPPVRMFACLLLLALTACDRLPGFGGGAKTAFDGDSAIVFARAQVDFGPRVPGTAAHRQAGDWIVARMRERADTVEVQEWTHVTADGRQLWVTHGDLFDGVIQCAKWLAYVGDSLYEFTLKLNRWFNSLRARLGLPYWSLSKYLKQKVKRAVSYVSDFEVAVAREARRRGVHGVVCGHIHHAELRDIDGILYANDGDWVESLTALVETDDGELRIVHAHDPAWVADAQACAS